MTLIANILRAGPPELSVKTAATVKTMAFSPDEDTLIVGFQSGVEYYSWPQGERKATLPVDMEHVHDLRFSNDGGTLLIAGGSPAEKGVLETWDWKKQRQIHRLSIDGDVLYRVAWSQDGTRYATAGADAICRVFDANNHQEVARYTGHSRPVVAIVFLPGSAQIASAGADATIRIWDSTNGQHIRTLDNHLGPIHCLVASTKKTPDGDLQILVSASEDRTIRTWQPQVGRMVRFTKLTAIPLAMVLCHDGKHLAIGCDDGSIRRVLLDSGAVVSETKTSSQRIFEILMNKDGGALVSGPNQVTLVQP
jgi:WD40 repeat protein